jgi:hypothetical protein
MDSISETRSVTDFDNFDGLLPAGGTASPLRTTITLSVTDVFLAMYREPSRVRISRGLVGDEESVEYSSRFSFVVRVHDEKLPTAKHAPAQKTRVVRKRMLMTTLKVAKSGPDYRRSPIQLQGETLT